MTLPSPDYDTTGSAHESAAVFRGPKSLCREFSLVLEARGIEYEARESGGSWVLMVPAARLEQAYGEISRYTAERSPPRRITAHVEPHSGATAGAIAYIAILLFTAYCAGKPMFGLDWLSLGDLDAGAPREWWRAITALTLHLDQEHLLGNLLFGVVAGVAAARLLGPGVAWAGILTAGALANYAEMLVAPPMHRALGASTAVFAALGLLAGMAWREQLSSRERAWYRWAPLIAGFCLLTLLGAGNEHVDVLGHGLGFLIGLSLGWASARLGISRNRNVSLQWVAGVGACLLVGLAWLLALTPPL